MARILPFAVALLVSAAWLQAQAESPTRAGSSQAGTAGGAQKVVEGCLQGSDGYYTVTDNSGRTYLLQGDTWKLTAHIGHEVRITGTTSGSGAQSSGVGAAETGTQQPILTVQSVKHISGACQSGTGI
jgi:hypothetical protein